MTSDEIVAKVQRLGLPEGKYIVYGSGPLAAAGIREAGDVDLYVTTDLLENLKSQGWKKITKGPGDEPYTYDVFEAHDNWDFSPYAPKLSALLKTATQVDGVPFASLEEVRKWKVASGGPKHLADVKLIDLYFMHGTQS